MKKARRRSFFTLVELMVSLVVFVILLGIMLQFFSGAQKMWTSMEKRNRVYADSRVAMDLITRLLQGQVSSAEIPFHVAANNREMAFFTKSAINLGGNRETIRLVRIFWNTTTNQLILDAVNDGGNNSGAGSSNSALEMPLRPANSGGGTPDLVSAMNSAPASANYSNIVILENLTGFVLTRIGNTSDPQAPEALRIQVTMMDRDSYAIWNDMPTTPAGPRDLYRNQHEYTFSRVVFFDDITQRVQ